MSHLKNGTCISISSLVCRRCYRRYRYSIEHTVLPTRLLSEVSVQYRTHCSTYETVIGCIGTVSNTLFYLRDLSDISVQYRIHCSTYETVIGDIGTVSNTLFYIRDCFRMYRYSIEHTVLPTRLFSDVSVQYRTHSSTY
jgi:hypothetical protein